MIKFIEEHQINREFDDRGISNRVFRTKKHI